MTDTEYIKKKIKKGLKLPKGVKSTKIASTLLTHLEKRDKALKLNMESFLVGRQLGKQRLGEALVLLDLALQNLDYENNFSEVVSLKYDIEKFLKENDVK